VVQTVQIAQPLDHEQDIAVRQALAKLIGRLSNIVTKKKEERTSRCAAVFLRMELRPAHLEGSIGVFCHDTAVCVWFG